MSNDSWTDLGALKKQPAGQKAIRARVVASKAVGAHLKITLPLALVGGSGEWLERVSAASRSTAGGVLLRIFPESQGPIASAIVFHAVHLRVPLPAGIEPRATSAGVCELQTAIAPGQPIVVKLPDFGTLEDAPARKPAERKAKDDGAVVARQPVPVREREVVSAAGALPEAEALQVAKLRKMGRGAEAIAHQLGLDLNAVVRHLKSLGLGAAP